MKRFSIKTRIIAAYTIVFAIVLAAFAWTVYDVVENSLVGELDTRLRSQAYKLQTEIEEQFDEHVFPDFPDLMEIQTEGLVSVHYRFLHCDGTVIINDEVLSSGPDPVLENYRDPISESALINGSRHRIFQRPAEADEQWDYILQVSASLAPIESALSNLMLLFLLAIPGALILGGIAAWYITRAAFAPVSSMTQTAEQISGGSLDTRIDLPPSEDEIRRLGETLNAMLDRIQRAVESQRQFVADASHELRTPLTILATELELIQNQHDAADVEKALNVTHRLAAMTSSMVLLSNLDSQAGPLKLEPVRLDELLVESFRMFQAAADIKGLEYRIRISEAAESNGDSEALSRLLMNLLDNAVKYTPNNGAVEVRLETLTDGKYCITIINSGPGIPTDEAGQLFNRFYRASTVRGTVEGSGLGLSIAKEIAERHKGTLTIESTENDEIRVILTLPA